jgi:putative ATP-dependent endonuclease of OLD family
MEWGGNMYISKLRICNFRKYGSRTTDNHDDYGITVNFNSKLNVLVGENDSGKTAIIDAIKLILGTQSNDYAKLEIEDFYLQEGKDEESRSKEFKIECIIEGFSIEEASKFIEWLSFKDNDGSESSYYLRLILTAKRESRGIFYDIKAGYTNEGRELDGKARELIKSTYLKPLRDAEAELSSKKNSRLSQILYNHEAFIDKDAHELIKIISEANKSIKNYFDGIDKDNNPLEDQSGKNILEDINKYLNSFSRNGHLLKSYFNIADVKLKSILEKLSINLSNNKSGLGALNLLFIATELLLLKRKNFIGLKSALIEEVEAHLHPQAQIRLVQYLQEECNKFDIQLILSTHSNNLASVVNIENILMCRNNNVFNMSSKYTKLRQGDYLYLQRFLDATKANLFFANGLIFVEGDAENLLIPSIASIIDLPLAKYGVSIVNVGSTAFLRYCNIFKRRDESNLIEIPVVCITDMDVKPFLDINEYKIGNRVVSYEECCRYNKQRKTELYTSQEVKCMVSPSWTLEYCIALGNLKKEFFLAVKFAEYIQNSEDYGLTPEKKLEGTEFVNTTLQELETQGKTNEEIAYFIYNTYMLNKRISKAIVAQCFSEILVNIEKSECKNRLESDINIAYLINSIKYVCGIEVQDID